MAISPLELQDAFIGLCATVDANYRAQRRKMLWATT